MIQNFPAPQQRVSSHDPLSPQRLWLSVRREPLSQRSLLPPLSQVVNIRAIFKETWLRRQCLLCKHGRLEFDPQIQPGVVVCAYNSDGSKVDTDRSLGWFPSQSRLFGKFQTNKRSCLTKQGEHHLRNIKCLPLDCTLMHTHACVTWTHTHTIISTKQNFSLVSSEEFLENWALMILAFMIKKKDAITNKKLKGNITTDPTDNN